MFFAVPPYGSCRTCVFSYRVQTTRRRSRLTPILFPFRAFYPVEPRYFVFFAERKGNAFVLVVERKTLWLRF